MRCDARKAICVCVCCIVYSKCVSTIIMSLIAHMHTHTITCTERVIALIAAARVDRRREGGRERLGERKLVKVIAHLSLSLSSPRVSGRQMMRLITGCCRGHTLAFSLSPTHIGFNLTSSALYAVTVGSE